MFRTAYVNTSVKTTGRLSKRNPNWEAVTIEANFQPETMAALCFVSLRTLERFFAADFGTTPTDWATSLRCRLARDRISEGYSDKAVVIEFHYYDEAHLCHDFKKMYGVPPQSFAPGYCKGGV